MPGAGTVSDYPDLTPEEIEEWMSRPPVSEEEFWGVDDVIEDDTPPPRKRNDGAR